jgi:DNA-3-methyladenine glycosylase I
MAAQLTVGADGKQRCWWCGSDPTYIDYHDNEWGKPLTDEHSLFELLCLEGAQAGLSWITILRKRDNYRRAFDGFDLETMAAYSEADRARLLSDVGIVRNRAKVAAFIGNAQALLNMYDRGETLKELVWSAALQVSPGGRRLHPGDEIPVTSPEAITLSKELLRKGFKFVGPTITYAYLQSSGVVDDHIVGCLQAEAR